MYGDFGNKVFTLVGFKREHITLFEVPFVLHILKERIGVGLFAEKLLSDKIGGSVERSKLLLFGEVVLYMNNRKTCHRGDAAAQNKLIETAVCRISKFKHTRGFEVFSLEINLLVTARCLCACKYRQNISEVIKTHKRETGRLFAALLFHLWCL